MKCFFPKENDGFYLILVAVQSSYLSVAMFGSFRQE